MLLFLFLLVIGFCALIYGANILVDGASSVAKRLRVSDMMIGLTIVAFGTSAPELVVNIFSSLEDNSDIALGNIVGSNIFNILGILGLSALIRPLTVDKATTWIQVPLTVLSAIALFLLLSDSCMDGATANVISRVDGCILLLFFAIFMGYVIQTSLSNRVSASEDDYKQMSWWKSILFVIGGLLLLVVGAKVIVDSAVKLAQMWGISQRVIGLTIISIGTSLPELATSVVAAKKIK
jgi:cation:H+ antiporter